MANHAEEITALRAERDVLQGQVEELKALVTDEHHKHGVTLANLGDLRTQLDAATVQYDAILTSWAELRAQLDAVTKERDNWKVDAARYSQNADHHRQKREAAEADLLALQVEHGRVKEALLGVALGKITSGIDKGTRCWCEEPGCESEGQHEPRCEAARKAISSPSPAAEVGKAIRLVIDERQRQQHAEGYSSGHDDQHVDNDLGRAAACYAAGSDLAIRDRSNWNDVRSIWPWNDHPVDVIDGKDRMRQIVIAGALILAEIERQLRTLGLGPKE